MKKRFIYVMAALACLMSIGVQSSFAAPAVCSSVLPVLGGGKFIYKNSAPLRNPRTGRIIGFRSEPTLIMYRNISSKGRISIYDSKGTAIGSCPWAQADGAAGGRVRCTMQTSSLRRTAVKNTRSPAVYIKINKSTCVNVPDAGKCFGSNKGLCNRVLK